MIPRRDVIVIVSHVIWTEVYFFCNQIMNNVKVFVAEIGQNR